MSEPICMNCGGLHYGSPRGKCVFICERCGKDIRLDISPRCECPPIPVPQAGAPRTQELKIPKDLQIMYGAVMMKTGSILAPVTNEGVKALIERIARLESGEQQLRQEVERLKGGLRYATHFFDSPESFSNSEFQGIAERVYEAIDGKPVTYRGTVPYLDKLTALRQSHEALLEWLRNIRNQVSNGKLCYFGDHTGYEPQMSSAQVEAWSEAISAAEEIQKGMK